MPELLATPSANIVGTIAPNSGTAAMAGNDNAAPELPFAALLQARLASATSATSPQADLNTLQALLADKAAPDTTGRESPIDPGTMIAGLLLLQGNAISNGGAKPGTDGATEAQTEPRTTLLADPSAASTALPAMVPVQIGPSHDGQLQDRGDQTNASAPRGTLTMAEHGRSAAATAIVADAQAVEAQTDGNAGKTGTEGSGSGQFQELLVAAQHAQGMTKAASSPSPAAPTRIDSPVGTTAWNDELGDKLVWMSNRNESRAELVLNPPHMGRIEVSITVNGDQANAVFVSANPAVRDALEGALPRLREVLADAGVRLDQAHVGSDSPGHQPDGRESGDNPRHQQRREERDFVPGLIPSASAASGWQTGGVGLVNTFA